MIRNSTHPAQKFSPSLCYGENLLMCSLRSRVIVGDCGRVADSLIYHYVITHAQPRDVSMSMSHQPWVRGAGGCQTFNHSELDAHHIEPSHPVEFYLTTHWRGRGYPPIERGSWRS